ncbi:MAG: glycosyltransferase [Gammaproteobacteria bacterium]|nr:glycosyltransferase [Gammaproteobacteria bacterium]
MVYSRKPVAVMCFSSGSGGMEISAVNLANLLSSEAKVILVGKKSSFMEKLYYEKGNDYQYESVDFRSRIFSLSMLFKVRSIIKKYGIENVIFLGASELKTLFFSFIGLSINLVVLHGTTKSRPKKDYLHKLIYSSVNYHVAVSEYLLRNVRVIVPCGRFTKYKAIRLSHVFNDADQIYRPRSDGIINIIHVGRIANGKGQVDAILACKQLRSNGINFRLMLLGSSNGSNYITEVKKAISDNQLEEFVILVGHVTNVESYLIKSDIMLFPSRGEGLSLAFIEALHHNVVCIAYDNTVFPEYEKMGFYIHLVEDGNLAALSDKLLIVANQLINEKEKSMNNIDLARKYFGVDRELNEWLEILI